jgi:hypothetical protein
MCPHGSAAIISKWIEFPGMELAFMDADEWLWAFATREGQEGEGGGDRGSAETALDTSYQVGCSHRALEYCMYAY